MTTQRTAFLDFTRQPDFKKILTNPILDIAARFWEGERYDAFKTCYRSMRVIDDLVDDRKSQDREISREERDSYGQLLDGWITALEHETPGDSFQADLMNIIERFGIPIWPWKRLVRAMKYDLDHDGFSSFPGFLRYCEGAAIAPASIFMHLCGLRSAGSSYIPPPFDIRKAARPLAVFSYLVHIIRDFEKDQRQGLNYFAASIMRRHDVSLEDLRSSARSERPSPCVRSLIGEYHRIMMYYQRIARSTVDTIKPALLPRYQLSLEVIYHLYHQIGERIDPEHGRFTTSELNPSPEQIQDRINQVISSTLP